MKLSKAYQLIIRAAKKNITHWTECLEGAAERGDMKSHDFWVGALEKERQLLDKYAAALKEIEDGEKEDVEIG